MKWNYLLAGALSALAIAGCSPDEEESALDNNTRNQQEYQKHRDRSRRAATDFPAVQPDQRISECAAALARRTVRPRSQMPRPTGN